VCIGETRLNSAQRQPDHHGGALHLRLRLEPLDELVVEIRLLRVSDVPGCRLGQQRRRSTTESATSPTMRVERKRALRASPIDPIFALRAE